MHFLHGCPLYPRARYGLINYQELTGLLGFQSMHDLAEAYRGWIDESVRKIRHFRDGKWTESVAVGNRAFVTETNERLGVQAKGRKLVGTGECCELREPPASNLRPDAFILCLPPPT